MMKTELKANIKRLKHSISLGASHFQQGYLENLEHQLSIAENELECFHSDDRLCLICQNPEFICQCPHPKFIDD